MLQCQKSWGGEATPPPSTLTPDATCLHQLKNSTVDTVNVNGEIHDSEWYETVKVKSTNIHFQLDSEAQCNVSLQLISRK